MSLETVRVLSPVSVVEFPVSVTQALLTRDTFPIVVTARCSGENISERAYIRAEARKEAANGYEIAEGSPAGAAALEAATNRLTIATHYKIPYPRPFNVPPRQSGAGRTPASALPEH